MAQEPIRIYADTSVFGGPFDDEFSVASQTFFEQIRNGRFLLVTSGLVQAEIESAPDEVRRLYESLLPLAEIVDPTPESIELRDAFLEARILTPRSADDALHVALATICRCSVIVSWNFRHIVHFRKIPLYNEVSERKGYSSLAIYSPREVIEYDDQDV